MARRKPEYVFDEKTGLPNYKRPWDFTVPTYPEIVHAKDSTTDRRPTGQLELVLDKVVKFVIVNGLGELMTAENLARWAAGADGFAASSSSVGRILHLWQDIDYAVVEERPLRFVTFTTLGLEVGLDEIHRRIRRKAKSEEAARYRESRK
ncbi:hypothetical protein Mbo2_056 [Rhodococcus phage Mbo2]|uniref:Uncharacterized protein n=1 Tax=Rhodococcus phage Mbo2 TaxID=2936911 RepID=A0A9E7LBM7_9CAUD|nr:hypothetical protein Mbo2_056 [Rhodococcus phage Mbo2]